MSRRSCPTEIELTLMAGSPGLDKTAQDRLQTTVASLLDIRPEQARTGRINERRVAVTMEMPLEAADRLLDGWRQGNAVLRNCLSPLGVVDMGQYITTVMNIKSTKGDKPRKPMSFRLMVPRSRFACRQIRPTCCIFCILCLSF